MKRISVWNRFAASAAMGLSLATVCGGQTFTASTPAAPGTGPFATTAKVEIDAAQGPLQLKREEQIAVMFLTSIENINRNCMLHAQRACTMAELMHGSPASVEHLKFNPGVDPNYTYTFASGGSAWEARAIPKKPGLTGFCFMSRSVGTTVATYNPKGPAGWTDLELTGRSIDGDSFDTM
jgi:hypothetical protein